MGGDCTGKYRRQKYCLHSQAENEEGNGEKLCVKEKSHLVDGQNGSSQLPQGRRTTAHLKGPPESPGPRQAREMRKQSGGPTTHYWQTA